MNANSKNYINELECSDVIFEKCIINQPLQNHQSNTEYHSIMQHKAQWQTTQTTQSKTPVLQFGQQRLEKTHSVTPNISKLHNSVLEIRQKSIEQIKSENIQNHNISTHITTTILYYTTKNYNKLATNRK